MDQERAKKEEEHRVAYKESVQQRLEHLKEEKWKDIYSIIKDMTYVEGCSFLMGNKKDSKNPPHIAEVKPFWIRKNNISQDEMWSVYAHPYDALEFCENISYVLGIQIQLPSREQLEYAVKSKLCKIGKDIEFLICDGSQSLDHDLICNYVNNSVKSISTIPKESDQLYYAACRDAESGQIEKALDKLERSLNAGFDNYTNMKNNTLYSLQKDIRYQDMLEEVKKREQAKKREQVRKSQITYSRPRPTFTIVCTSPEFHSILENYKKKEEDEKRCIEEELETLWHSVVDPFFDNIEHLSYEERSFFRKKSYQIRYLKEPLTWRIWNAIMNRDSLEKWASKDLQKKHKDVCLQNSFSEIRKYNLDAFLNKLNEYRAGKMRLDFVYNDKKTEEKLQKNKIVGQGIYLYVKED